MCRVVVGCDGLMNGVVRLEAPKQRPIVCALCAKHQPQFCPLSAGSDSPFACVVWATECQADHEVDASQSLLLTELFGATPDGRSSGAQLSALTLLKRPTCCEFLSQAG